MNGDPLRLVLPMAIVLSCAPLSAQEPAPAKPDPGLAARLDAMLDAARNRGAERDGEAIRAIEQIAAKGLEGRHPGDVRKVVIALGKVLRSGPRREPKQMAIYRAAADALGKFGPAASRVLTAAYDDKARFPKHDEWLPLRERLLEGLAATGDERNVKFLCDVATRSNSDALMAVAGGALVQFAGSDQKVRKEIAKRLLKKYGELEAAKNSNYLNIPGRPQNFAGSNAKETLAAITPRWLATLGKMTGQEFTKHEDWQRWFNKNKGRNWDKKG